MITQKMPYAVWTLTALAAWVLTGGQASLAQVDYQKLVSRADLHYEEPTARSEEGMPIGNGTMGSLVWTISSAIKFQINRVDVFGQNRATNSFPQRDSDYAAGCGYVDIDFVNFGEDVFAGSEFAQHLSLYDGLMTVKGEGVTTRILAWPERDLMAVEVEDQRAHPEAVSIDLRMLRFAVQYHAGENYRLAQNHTVKYRKRNHTATSDLDIREGRIVLTQMFEEGDYYNASALAIGVAGRASKPEYANEATVRLTAVPGQGRFTILIATAASFEREDDIGALAIEALKTAESQGFDSLRKSTAAWWHEFWKQGFVHLHSADGEADLIEKNYTYFLYLMGSSSRGAYPPRFGGMLWRTTGDLSRWGSQHWWANTYSYYGNLMPSNRLALMDPMFKMYLAMYDSAAVAARQQWGSKGIWIPETVWFDGLDELPEEIAEEMRELYLMRKPWEERSRAFREYAEPRHPHDSRWNWKGSGRWVDGRWVFPDKGKGPFGHTTHILGVAGRIALLCWDRYLFTMDEQWLREKAYPMLQGAVEFYRNFPNLRKGEDGLYHLYHVNSGEGNWDSQDTPYELGVLHRILPAAVRASEILNIDVDLRTLWREFHENLTPGPARQPGFAAFRGFGVRGGGPVTPETTDAELKQMLVDGVRLEGREQNYIDSEGSGWAGIMRNRLRLREGPGAIDGEHLGATASRVHDALLQSQPVSPSEQPTIEVFPWWPEDWNATFKLQARGAVLVSSSIQNGRVGFVKIESLAGSECHLLNPWGGQVSLYRNGQKWRELDAALLVFPTSPGDQIMVVPAGIPPSSIPRARVP